MIVPVRWKHGPLAAAQGNEGFTYIGLLLLIAMMVIGMGAASEVWYTHAQREKEGELLDIGEQFQSAISRYYNSSPGQVDRLPRQLDDLLKDNRFPGTRRYLRKIYRDPMTGGTDWGLVKTADGYIIGVFSQSEKEPLKKANFPLKFREFEERAKYAEWVFLFQPARRSPAAARTGGAPITKPPKKP